MKCLDFLRDDVHFFNFAENDYEEVYHFIDDFSSEKYSCDKVLFSIVIPKKNSKVSFIRGIGTLTLDKNFRYTISIRESEFPLPNWFVGLFNRATSQILKRDRIRKLFI